jgi:quercetin dioxygenase-like cupin family protein
MFSPKDEYPFVRVPDAPGVRRRCRAYGSQTLLAEFILDAGADLARHSHPHEQTGYLVSGKLRMTVDGGEVFVAGPGDSWTIPGGVFHKAEPIEECHVLEVFSPCREEYLPGK